MSLLKLDNQKLISVKLISVKKGDIVRYPVGFSLSVKKVYADENGDLFVKQIVGNDKDSHPRYIYKTMEGYKWDTRLCIELGFDLANDDEIQYLED